MALVQRINACTSPLLNTFCYKYTVNIIRYKTKHSSQEQLDKKHGRKVNMEWNLFHQGITFRQAQANRSILIKIKSMNHIHRLSQLCSTYGHIVEMFPYTTDRYDHYLLVEFRTVRSANHLSGVLQCSKDNNIVHCTSDIYRYSGPYDTVNEALAPIQTYSLTNPFTAERREQLLSMKNASDQMHFLHNIFKFTELNLRLRFYTARQLSYHFSKLFINVSILPFGSTVNGFGQEGCDLDLLCKIQNVKLHKPKNLNTLAITYSITNREEQQKFLDVVGTVMHACIPGIVNIRKILNARVPIIKFLNKNTNMNCDLSSTNEVALSMSQTLYTYAELDSRVKPLVCIIRKWAKCNGVTKDNSGHWITNFSLTLLLIFYLQTKNCLPSLNSILSHIGDSKTSEESRSYQFQLSNTKDSSADTKSDNVYNLLQGFFEYYSLFNYRDNGICIRSGRIRNKPNNSALYIFNPFDDTLNVSKNVNSMELLRIVDRFRDALYILNNVDESECIIKLLDIKKTSTNSGPSQQIHHQIYSNVNEQVPIAAEPVRERRIIK